MRKRKAKKELPIPEDLLPTGSTLLNCVLADNPWGGYRKGTIINLIGDSSAGKSILAFTTFAATNAAGFDDYRFIYDDAECAMAFDMEKLFGKSTAKRIEPPARDENKEPLSSDTIEDFHMHVKDALKSKEPFVYILDSFDSLDADADEKKLEEALEARRKGKDSAGSYGTSKARKASEILRNIRGDLKKTNSILVIISQVRDNLNAGMFGSKRTRSGGKALKHYSWYEIWLHLGKQIKSKDRMIGVTSIPKVSKNRQTGKNRECVFPIYYDLGVDDIGSCVDFLINEGHWKKKKQTIAATEIDFEGTRQKIISHIEENNLENKLYEAVGNCWNEIEESLKLNRKARFE